MYRLEILEFQVWFVNVLRNNEKEIFLMKTSAQRDNIFAENWIKINDTNDRLLTIDKAVDRFDYNCLVYLMDYMVEGRP